MLIITVQFLCHSCTYYMLGLDVEPVHGASIAPDLGPLVEDGEEEAHLCEQ